ncbi:glutathione S-transferase [Rhodobacteraceae bacterium 2CG4]|uniref:Glutathione S-transferase n=1 Tax=Halovulum marinum TaxID=2662447 RepID=A0A6L5Z262_9RHOB|nr:glutathione S-transferase [Halovulum marinum]MSU90617.1 glutathione S-transferase [Halovulum marinum]
MTLYYNPASPYARKARVVAMECGLGEEVALEQVAGHPTEPGTMPVQRNPLGKIPVLERPDGPALHDSRVICRYLDHLGGGRLYPDPPRLWETLTLESLADGINDAAVLMVYETRSRAFEKQDPDWVEAQWAKIARALDALETLWMPSLRGPLDAGALALGCALGYLDLRHEGRGWRDGHPALAEWYAEFARRDSMVYTEPSAY